MKSKSKPIVSTFDSSICRLITSSRISIEDQTIGENSIDHSMYSYAGSEIGLNRFEYKLVRDLINDGYAQVFDIPIEDFEKIQQHHEYLRLKYS